MNVWNSRRQKPHQSHECVQQPQPLYSLPPLRVCTSRAESLPSFTKTFGDMGTHSATPGSPIREMATLGGERTVALEGHERLPWVLELVWQDVNLLGLLL